MTKYINRTIETKFKKIQNNYPVILVTGPRQSGKSTMLEYITSKINQKINYVTLDDLNNRAQAQSDPELFLRSHETPLLIDEFQYAPNLLSYIKIIVDNKRKEELFSSKSSESKPLYYLTGSKVFETMEEASESLAGRVGILDLYPLSTREIEGKSENIFIPDIKKIKKTEPLDSLSTSQIFERIFRGSYPELYKNKNMDVEMYFSSYLRTYMERDVRQLINVKNEVKFLKFISSVAARTGQEYNATDIATDVGIDNDTVNSWMSILKNSYLVYLLPPHMNNNVGRIIKRPKIYFMDTGLASYLTGYVSSETLERSSYSGAIFETYIVSEIIKSYTNNGRDPRLHLYYYRDNHQKEIDLLVIDGDNIYPVEIKKNSNPGLNAIKNFDVVSKFEMNSPNGVVLCMSSEIRALDKNNYVVPIEYI